MKDSTEKSKKGDGIPVGAIGEALGQMGLPGLIIGGVLLAFTLIFNMISLVRKTDEINDYYRAKKL